MEYINTDKLTIDSKYSVAYRAYNVDLQLFAGEKTEKATPKKRREAREKGQVLHSREISTAITLLCVFIGLRIFGPNIYLEISKFINKVFTEYADSEKLNNLFTLNSLTNLFIDTMLVLLRMMAPLLAIALISGFIVGYAQVGFLFTFETLSMKFNRINPLNGFKRLFSSQALVELVKSIVKIAVAGYVAYSYLNGEKETIAATMNMSVMNSAIYIAVTSINVAIRICAVLIILSVFDYGYQWWQYEKNLKMSKQEIKEEFKQTEGNPEIKSKIRQKQRQMSMRRMMQEVPKADVVITNPTHFAVAVKYDAEVSDAPVVLAKGQDFMAIRIKEIARENKVEVVENKPLARSLYNSVEIGGKIPSELYQAVAEVLAFVYSLKGKGRAG